MVSLACLRPLAVLEFQAGHVCHDGADVAVFVLWAQDVALPVLACLICVVHVAADVALVQLQQDVGHVQRLRAC